MFYGKYESEPGDIGYWLQDCSKCSEYMVFRVVTVEKRFSVYFWRVLSYSDMYLICMACQTTFKVPRKQKPVVEMNLLHHGQLSDFLRHGNSGVNPEFIYAFHDSGRIVNKQTPGLLSAAERHEWQAAIDEHRYRRSRA